MVIDWLKVVRLVRVCLLFRYFRFELFILLKEIINLKCIFLNKVKINSTYSIMVENRVSIWGKVLKIWILDLKNVIFLGVIII